MSGSAVITPDIAVFRKNLDIGDGAHAKVGAVYLLDPLGNPVHPVASDRELQATIYVAKKAWSDVSIGDIVRHTVAYDASGQTLTIVSELWEDDTQGKTVISPPSRGEYLTSIIQGDSLSLAQLLSAGLATASNQVTQIGYLADIADGNDKYASLKLVKSEEISDVLYVLKSDGTRWLMTRITSTETTKDAMYAGQTNNPNLDVDSAWNQRESLVYGLIGGA